MTLTFETAKHAIDKYGRVINIVEEEDILDDYSIVREDALNPSSSEYSSLKPCIVVTTAREALEAAWELAHEVKGETVPSGQAYIRRGPLSFLYTVNTYGYVHECEGSNANAEHRLLDSPEPDPEPEPWEVSRYCYANGNFYKRLGNEYGTYWRRASDSIAYSKEDMAKLNPKLITIEGDEE